MRLLLDTHALIWWWNEDSSLSATARSAIMRNGATVSAVSAFEIETKYRLGKLSQAKSVVEGFGKLIERDQFEQLPISVEHARRAGALPVAHADPFDRLLAAQAELDELVLVTRDPAFAAFPCVTRW